MGKWAIGVQIHILDRTQVRPKKGCRQQRGPVQMSLRASRIVAHAMNPLAQDPLYHKFCLGYTDACPKESEEAVELNATFLRAIKVERATSDSVSTMT